MKVEILKPSGYCYGVDNAIKLAYKAKEENKNNTIYILGMLVHNVDVVKKLLESNIKTVFDKNKTLQELIKAIPDYSVIIFTAHGHDEKLDEIAKNKHLKIYDAVCLNVLTSFKKIKDKIKNGHQVIYIGIKGHPETVAALSIDKNVFLYDKNEIFDYTKINDPQAYVINQTTLNYLELEKLHTEIKKHIPLVEIENEICPITRLRQSAIKKIESDVDLIIVVGDIHSSNTLRLYEIAKTTHPYIETIKIANLNELDDNFLKNKKHIVISSGASTPKETIEEIYQYAINFD